jgi:putative Ca2+/H+ antiporter (TMEM165/GDT1 family)
MARPAIELGETFGFRVLSFCGVGGAESHWLCPTPPRTSVSMEAFLVSTGIVAIAEIGDKTQLLAILLAARFRKPAPILLGIFVATIANHALAAAVGSVAGTFFDGPWMKWVLGLAFIAFAAWALIPDQFEDKDAPREKAGASIFWTTLVAFFLVEMGDKTQVATVALGARFHEVALVAAGTTVGMMLANTPAVFLGEVAATRLPLKAIRIAAAISFAAIGLWILIWG